MPGYSRNADLADPAQPYVMCLGRNMSMMLPVTAAKQSIGARQTTSAAILAISHREEM